MRILSYIFPQTIYQSTSHYNKTIEVKEINGRNVLLVNGIEQTGRYTEKLWTMGLRGIYPKNILVFGVGGGTVFKHFPKSQITAVDIDNKIIQIAIEYFGIRNVTLIESDARLFDTDKKFDLVIVDLYIGNDVPNFVTQKPFLARIFQMVAPGGQMVLNYYNQNKQEQTAAKIVSMFHKAIAKPVLRNIFVYVVK